MIDCIFVNGKEGVGHLLSQILDVVVIKYLNIEMEKGKGAMSVTYLSLITTTNMLQTLPPSPSPNLVYKYLKIAD